YPTLNPNTEGYTSVVIDLLRGPTQPLTFPLQYNAFCSGHAQAADGSIFVVGGDAQDSNFTDGTTFLVDGRERMRFFYPNNVSLYDNTQQGTWNESIAMSTRRWYPTVVTMSDGDFIIASGDTLNLNFDSLADTDKNPTFEYYPPRYGGGPWESSLL
ncbi:hypothetical protein HK405_015398, partial [Cladochytrium tenue]